jgi:hypothetical protein
MGKREVISIEEYLSKRKAIKEREDTYQQNESDLENSQAPMPLNYYWVSSSS